MNPDKKVLVTGGRGFIGVNLVRAISPAKTTAVLDNLKRASPTGWDEALSTLCEGDILNPEFVTGCCGGTSQVVHLAAYGSVVESIADPERNFEVNVQGTLNMLRAAVDAGVRRFIFASTGGALIGDATPAGHRTCIINCSDYSVVDVYERSWS